MIKHMFNIRRMRTTLRLHNRSMERGFLFSIVSNKSIPCIRGYLSSYRGSADLVWTIEIIKDATDLPDLK